MAMDATFHARAELMEDFKVGQHADWDLDFEINVQNERKAELDEAGGKGEVAGKRSTPRVESPRMSKPAQVKVGSEVATQEEGAAKDPSEEHKGDHPRVGCLA